MNEHEKFKQMFLDNEKNAIDAETKYYSSKNRKEVFRILNEIIDNHLSISVKQINTIAERIKWMS